ncbi:phage tail tape measure protein [Luteibacter sp.]|uniref:phage tail tape measure protein n=1 Tax=Luteibacter sp. TaxID=1886636 RepID=UPI0025B81BEE|nr:phage tail tape measure protein [Luteibacter sp.]
MRIGVVDATGGGILKLAAQFDKAQKSAKGLLDTIIKINEATRRGFSSTWADSAASGFDRAHRAADGYASSAERASRASGGMSVYGGGGSGFGGAGGGGMMAIAAFAGARGGSAPMLLGGPGQRLLTGTGGALALGGPAANGPLLLTGSGSGGGMSGGGVGGGMGMPGMAAAGWAGWRGWRGGGGGAGGGGSGSGGGFGGFGGLIGGDALAGTGRAMFGMLGGPIDKASEYEQAQARFRLFGMSDAVNREAVKFAEGMHIIGTSIIDAMNNVTEAQGVFRESGLDGSKALEGAKLAAPVLAKIAYATQGLDGASQSRMHTQSLAMLRFIEMRGGLKDAATFNSIADQGWKAIRSSGGNVDWEQLRQFIARGGVAAQGLNNEALFGKLEPVIGELKGSTAGNAWMTSYNRLVGGVRIPNQVAHLLADNGIWDASKIQWNSQGGIKQFKGNPLRDMATFASDPVEFYEKNILPMYARMGIATTAEKARENTMIFGRTGGAMFSLIDRQLAAIHHSDEAQKKALGINASVDEESQTYRGQYLRAQKELETASVRLGAVVLPMLVKGLQFVTPLIEKIATWINDHSTLTKGLVIVFGAVAALAVIGGSILAVGGALTLIGTAVTAAGGLGGLLTGVGAGLGAIASAAGVFMAAYIGWKTGGWLNDNAINPLAAKVTGQKDDTLSGTLYDLWNPFNKATGKREFKPWSSIGRVFSDDPLSRKAETDYMSRSPFVAPKKPTAQGGGAGDVYLDGKKVGKYLAPHFGDMLSAPQRGGNAFDFSATPAPVGMNQAR